jgi:hypothetical protein
MIRKIFLTMKVLFLLLLPLILIYDILNKKGEKNCF